MKPQTSQAKAKATKELKELTSKVDRLAELEQELHQTGVADKIKEAAQLKKELREYLDTHITSPEEEVVLVGTTGELTFGPCRKERKVHDKKRLLKHLSRVVFDQLARFTLKDLEQRLNAKQIAEVTREEYGARPLVKFRIVDRRLH